MARTHRSLALIMLLHRLGEIAIPVIHKAISPAKCVYHHRWFALHRRQGAGPDQPAQHSFGGQAQDDIDTLPE